MTLTAKSGDRTASAKVSVAKLDKTVDSSFRNHVQPVLAKSGCSSGACHGAAGGKNGFQLSLRGYDDEGDFCTITRHAGGRRIVPERPGAQPAALKPTGAVPHKGGVRFDVGSLEYNALGRVDRRRHAAAAEPTTRGSSGLEVLPAKLSLKPGMKQQLLVLAHFTDGHVEDVTRWAKYTPATNRSPRSINSGR